MNYDFDTICFRELEETPEDLFGDCQGIIHLITEKNAYQVYYDTTSINLLYPVPKNDFYETMSKCIVGLDEMFYICQYVLHSQIIHYYYYNIGDSSLNELTMIADEKAIFRMQDLPRFIAMGTTWTEADQRFEEMFFMAPIFARLVKIKNSIFIFNFVDSKISVYSKNATLAREIPISFHNQKYWKEELFIDDITGKAYTMTRRNGISAIYEININDGTFKFCTQVPGFKFVDTIKIHNGKLYFIYTNRLENESRTLYIMKINLSSP